MDDALVLFIQEDRKDKLSKVLILVVMDDALVQTVFEHDTIINHCLNPCCNG